MKADVFDLVPDGRKILVSIDQPFLSDFARNEERMVPLRDELTRLIAHGKVRCPLHLWETQIEAALCPKPKTRHGIVKVANELSLGLAFPPLEWLIALDSLMLVRPNWHFGRIFEGTIARPWDGWDKAAIRFRQLKEDFNRRCFSQPDPKKYEKGMSIGGIRESLVEERAASMFRLLEHRLRRTPSINVDEEWDMTVEAARVLFFKLQASDSECEQLIQLILDRHWECTGTLFAHSTLGAVLEFDRLAGRTRAKKPRSRSANDYFDVLRVAVGISEAHVVLCDARTKRLIDRSNLLEIWTKVRVFGSNEPGEALKYFQTVG